MLTKTDPAPETKVETPPATPSDCHAVKGYDWDHNIAFAICMAEAKKDADHPYGIARWNNAGLNNNGSVDYGLMQINSIHADMVGGDLEQLYKPEVNMKIAYSLSRGGTDWTPWSAYNNGSYRTFLK